MPQRRFVRLRRLDILVIGIVMLAVGAFLIFMWLERSYQKPNYSLIEDGLYMGGDADHPPPWTRAVLNLCKVEDSYHCEVHWWAPTHDGAPAPGIDWLKSMVDYIREQRNDGLTVYVHCRNGVNRSGMVVTAYLMHKNKWTRDRALAYIRKRRPLVRPNTAFMKRLLEWEKIVLQKAP